MSLISVIVPVYNVEKYLNRCVDSILGQTFKDFKVILVNDVSPHSFGKICDEYALKDNRVHVIHQENKGVAIARNTGLDWIYAHSSSKWISFVDSDDWIHPQYLESLLQAAQENDVLLSVCGMVRAEKVEEMQELSLSYYVEDSEKLYLEFAKETINVVPWGKLYNRKCFEKIRYPEGKRWEDLATTYKLILGVPSCSVVRNVLYYYFNNLNGIVKGELTPNRLDEFEAYETQLDFFARNEKWKDIHMALYWNYIKAISYSGYMLRVSSMSAKNKKKYGKIIQKKMKKALKGYDKKINIKENLSIYEIAYPCTINVFYVINNILNKFKKN